MQVRSGRVRSGQVRSDQVRLGQIRLGEVYSYSRASGDGLLTEWGVFPPAFEVPKDGALTDGKAKGGGGVGAEGSIFLLPM
jgi:hypothetical protein